MSSSVRRTRRSFGTIWPRHLGEDWQDILGSNPSESDREAVMTAYFEWLKNKAWEEAKFTSGAVALEPADTTGGVHVQFYVEHSQKRATTLCNDFGLCNPTVFYDTVRSGQGSWDYCTGQGKHEGKPAIDRFQWGEPVLWGGSESKASLRWVVEQIVDGASPADILSENPYAYAVHRRTIWDFFEDFNDPMLMHSLHAGVSKARGEGKHHKGAGDVTRAP